MDQDQDLSVRSISDGFTALAEEYRTLAQQHELLERKLAATVSQIESLRQFLPADHASTTVGIDDKKPEDLKICTFRNLDEWLKHMSEKDMLKDKDSLETIHRAQLARLRIRTRSQPDYRARRRSDVKSPLISRSQSRAPSQPPIPEEPPMEQDFTEINNPGELGCPLAPKSLQRPGDYLTIPNTSHNLPTPQGSGSYDAGSRSKRASFVDPIRPDLQQPDITSPAESINESTSVACPIRFLEQHSPEDMAKYFEEHKHELPRSHEVCVKRFQSDANSIRQMDTKYGNIVTMIQGLGKKHKPMLPEVPNTESVAEVSEEQRAKRRVKNWAASVSKFHSQDEAGQATSEQDQTSVDAVNERIPHFERDLDDIRVGESPSRPWGVTVPRHDDDHSVASSTPVAATAASAAMRIADSKKDKDVVVLASAQDNRVLAAIRANREHNKPVEPLHSNNGDAERPRGKCPFDHAALLSRTTVAQDHQQDLAAATIDAQETNHPQKHQFDHSHLAPSSTVVKPEPSSSGIAIEATSTQHAAVASEAGPPRIVSKYINYGTAVVANHSQLPPQGLENHGLLLLGYAAATAKELMAAVPAMSRRN